MNATLSILAGVPASFETGRPILEVLDKRVRPFPGPPSSPNSGDPPRHAARATKASTPSPNCSTASCIVPWSPPNPNTDPTLLHETPDPVAFCSLARISVPFCRETPRGVAPERRVRISRRGCLKPNAQGKSGTDHSKSQQKGQEKCGLELNPKTLFQV